MYSRLHVLIAGDLYTKYSLVFETNWKRYL
jgi:hypothetical protein